VSDSDFYLIAFNRLDATQRRLIHAKVKELSAGRGWWHHWDDVWVVRGHSASRWREALGDFVPDVPSGVLVFRLPASGEREWSGRGKREAWEWFQKNYASPSGAPPRVGD
jgi:hypothetical protein